jgi:hypothetical protein
MRDR